MKKEKNKKKWEKVCEKKRQIHNFASLSVLKWPFDRQMKQTRLKAHIYTHISTQVIGLRSKKETGAHILTINQKEQLTFNTNTNVIGSCVENDKNKR